MGRWFSKNTNVQRKSYGSRNNPDCNGKFLQLVKAGEQYFVIAVGKDEVTKIAELTEDQLSVQTSDDMKNSQENFQEIFSRLKDHFPKSRIDGIMTKLKRHIVYCH